ncbi:MAG: hypothetical protein MUE85_12695 [Microscillaceae bacterium]|nr:hypothetical protein [Microscillaceae bacterium]
MTHTLFAQFNTPTVVVNGRTYVRYIWAGGNYSVFNQANPDLPRRSGHRDCDLATMDYSQVKTKINEVFSATRRTALSNEIIMMKFWIKPSTGELLQIVFTVSNNTQITPQEIYALENKLKTLNFPQPTVCHIGNYVVAEAQIVWK